MTIEAAAIIASWIAILLLGLAVAGLLAQVRFLTEQISGMRETIPVGATTASHGRHQALRHPDLDPPYLALVVEPGCVACRDLVPSAIGLLGDADLGVTTYLVSAETYDVEDGAGFVRVVDPAAVVALAVTAFPTAVVADPAGTIVHHAPVGSARALERAIEVGRDVATRRGADDQVMTGSMRAGVDAR